MYDDKSIIEINTSICRYLGVDPEMVSAIDIEIRPGLLPECKVTMLPEMAVFETIGDQHVNKVIVRQQKD
tara:strand:+ start:525 stop:734 length:210 start_codon:yes stop_codon:yes gene_type:complete